MLSIHIQTKHSAGYVKAKFVSAALRSCVYEGQNSLEGWAHADDSEDERYRAPALDKGLDISRVSLAGVDGGLTQAEIAKKLDRSPNVGFYRMLDRLVRRWLLASRGSDGDRYSLTLKRFGLAQLHYAGAPPGFLRHPFDARAGRDLTAGQPTRCF